MTDKTPDKPAPKERKTPPEWATDIQVYGKRSPDDHTPRRDCDCEPRLVGLPGPDGRKVAYVLHR